MLAVHRAKPLLQRRGFVSIVQKEGRVKGMIVNIIFTKIEVERGRLVWRAVKW